jgi:hypothetical protein
MIYPKDHIYIRYDGDWLNDKMNGTGIIITNNNSRYEGQVKNN